jgi:hypothetical protein
MAVTAAVAAAAAQVLALAGPLWIQTTALVTSEAEEAQKAI